MSHQISINKTQAIIFSVYTPHLPVFFVLLQLVGKLCTSGI
ncbi:hypothetical protein DXA67_19005 [Bacteroides fragilis]|nr:hypothetical protein DXA67_19005 [Bacteroides fragilis]